MPDTRALYEELHRDGFEVVGVSIDESPEAAENAAKAHKLAWRQVCDGQKRSGPLVEPFRVNGIPDSVLFDRSGRVRAIGLRGVDLEENVRRLVAEEGEEGTRGGSPRDKD